MFKKNIYLWAFLLLKDEAMTTECNWTVAHYCFFEATRCLYGIILVELIIDARAFAQQTLTALLLVGLFAVSRVSRKL
jgi:hypothetical protein